MPRINKSKAKGKASKQSTNCIIESKMLSFDIIVDVGSDLKYRSGFVLDK